jgi:hypothetical protein
MEFHATGAEVVQHHYQVAQAAAQPVEHPHDQRVTGAERLQATEQGMALNPGLDVFHMSTRTQFVPRSLAQILNSIDHWLGGVHLPLRRDKAAWPWDRAAFQLVCSK